MQWKMLTWSNYIEVLHARFSNELFGDPTLEMKYLRKGSFAEYQRQINTLLHKIQLDRDGNREICDKSFYW